MEDWYTRGENAFLKAYGRYDVVLEKGEGVYLYDTNGHRYLDFYSGIGVNSLGYHYPAYVEAMQKQIATLTHVSNYFYTPIAVEAAEAVKAGFTGSCHSPQETCRAAGIHDTNCIYPFHLDQPFHQLIGSCLRLFIGVFFRHNHGNGNLVGAHLWDEDHSHPGHLPD